MKFAICNETFEGWEHARICNRTAELGYTGLEIAPFTLPVNFRDVPALRREMRNQAEAAGVSIIGLHWLLKDTRGYYLTSPDAEVQRSTGEYFASLAESCADLGGRMLVLGSPMQRNLLPGVTSNQADDYAAKTIAHCLSTLAKTGVVLALEPLGRTETDYLNRAVDAVALRNRIDHPNVRLHLDVKAMADEGTPIPDIIRMNAQYLAHFHANDPNRRGPGFGDTDFRPIFAALNDAKYDSWVSVEVFDYSPDPDTIARESIRYMKECITP